MINVSITYNGKEYSDLNAALHDATQNAMLSSLKRVANDRLKPFKSEIENQNGTITVEVASDFKSMQIKITGVEKELGDRIRKAFGQN